MDRHTRGIQKTEVIELDTQSSKTKPAGISEVTTLSKTEDPEIQKQSSLKQPPKKHVFLSRRAEWSTAPLNTPVQGEPLTTRSVTPAASTRPHTCECGY